MKRLGGLESEVMDLLWDAEEPQSVRDLVDRFEGWRPEGIHHDLDRRDAPSRKRVGAEGKTKPRIHLFAIA